MKLQTFVYEERTVGWKGWDVVAHGAACRHTATPVMHSRHIQTFMYEERTVGWKERDIVIAINNLYPDDRDAVLVSSSGVVRSDLEPVEILDLAVEWNGRLDDASSRRINDERRLRVTGGDFIENFTERTAVGVTSLHLSDQYQHHHHHHHQHH